MKRSILKSKYNIGIMVLVAVLFLGTASYTFGFVIDNAGNVPGTRLNFVSDAGKEFSITPGITVKEPKVSLSIIDTKETICKYDIYLNIYNDFKDVKVVSYFDDIVQNTNIRGAKTLIYNGEVITNGNEIKTQKVNVEITNNDVKNINAKLSIENVECK